MFSQAGLAVLPSFDNFPKLPMFGDFDPSILQKYYNQFTDKEPDFEREERLISPIEDSLMDGDVEYLPVSNNREAFSIFMEADADQPKGGVILLHSRGFHANWDSVVKPLRVGLAEKGWHTLSVQMPVLDKKAKYYDYVPIFPYAHERIDAAISFYKKIGVDNIVVIGHGCGAHMTMSYIDKRGDDEISAFVGIGMGATDYKQKIVKEFPLDRMLSPVLDIFGENDFPGVIRTSKFRQDQMDGSANSKSTQKIVKDADHYYTNDGNNEALLESINNWLNQL